MAPTYGKHEKPKSVREWLARHMLNPTSKQSRANRQDKSESTGERLFIQRPVELVFDRDGKPVGLSTTVTGFEGLFSPQHNGILVPPPPQPPRQDSGVAQNVEAWLDTSIDNHPQPLMRGLHYWRKGNSASPSPIKHMQYAHPIGQRSEGEPASEAPSVDGYRINAFSCSGKRVQVRMPTMLRAGSHHKKRKQRKTQSKPSSKPPVSVATNDVGEVPTQMISLEQQSEVQSGMLEPAVNTLEKGAWTKKGYRAYPKVPCRIDTPASRSASVTNFDTSSTMTQGRTHAVYRQSPTIGVQSEAMFPREHSMKTMSDAPTYASGTLPPSYRSRTTSVLTVSSFGCVDGMDAERRQASQQRAAQRAHGVKGRFRKLRTIR